MNENKKKTFIYIILIIATLVVYWQVNQFDFVNFDDNAYITENYHIKLGLSLEGIRWAFSITYADWWMPLVRMSYLFNYQLNGLNAGGYHLTNLILHILSTILLFWLFNRMTGATWKSAFVAALFALHPLHVESVAWIVERKDVLSAFFWMLTLCFYIYYTEKPVTRRYLLVLFSFVCALMSKPMVITLPVIMILLDYWPLERFKSEKGNLILWQLKEKIPFFVLSAVFVIMTLNRPTNPFVNNKYFTLSSRIANAFVSFLIYLEKTFWPQDMAVFYPFPTHIPIWQVLGALLLITFFTVITIVMAKRLPYLFTGWLWYAVTILPVIGIINFGASYSMADRYHYLPSIGLSVMLAWGIPSLIKSESKRKKILFPASIAAIAIMAILTWQQCGYWKNSISLFSHAVEVTKNNYLAHTNLANALVEKENFYKAIYHSNKSINIDPHIPINYLNRGKAYARLEKHQLAIEDFNKVISSNPNDIYSYYNRGSSYGKTGQFQLAIDDFNKAIHLKPDYVEAYNNRGIVQYKLGLYQKAIDDFNESIRLKPDYADAWNNRAFTYLNLKNTNYGCSDAKKACTLGKCNTLKNAKSRELCN